MTTASKTKYIDIVSELPHLQNRVFNTIKSLHSTQRSIDHIVKSSNLGYSTVTGRLSELQDKGLIKESGKDLKGQTIWEIVNPMEVQELAEIRRAKKFDKAVTNFVKNWGDDLDGETLNRLKAYL